MTGQSPAEGEGLVPWFDTIWITCPSCKGLYMVDRIFWKDEFDDLKLCCPYCNHLFEKKESPKTVGL